MRVGRIVCPGIDGITRSCDSWILTGSKPRCIAEELCSYLHYRYSYRFPAGRRLDRSVEDRVQPVGERRESVPVEPEAVRVLTAV